MSLRTRRQGLQRGLEHALAVLLAITVASVASAQSATGQNATSTGGAPPSDVPAAPAPTRLTVDPEAPEPVEGWWTNAAQLLELSPDGMYRLFATQNRFEKPLEVGRWVRQNYATLWLEPYSARKEARSRVSLVSEGNSTQLAVRKFEPMVRIDSPPLVEEDFVLGLWLGQGGSLELKPSMRYRYVVPTKTADARPVVIASHQGSWRLKDGRVELTPDSPSISKSLFEPARDESGRPYMRLRGVEGMLERFIEPIEKPRSEPEREAATTSSDSGATTSAPASAPASNNTSAPK